MSGCTRLSNRGPPVGQFHDAANHRQCRARCWRRYDVAFCDVWGVMHNGRRRMRKRRGAGAVRAEGGHGHPRLQRADPGIRVERVLDKTACAATPGTHRLLGRHRAAHIAEKGYRRMHWVGPSERDYAL